MMTRAAGRTLARVRRAARAASPRWDRVKAAHRRYTGANGDALSGALTYALLICGAPALVLAVLALKELGAPATIAGHPVRHAAGVLLPPQIADAVGHIPQLSLGLRLGLAAALVWMALRLVRALRTGVRAMCGQNAGSGNPLRDTIRDAVLGLLLLAAATVVVYLTAVVDGRAQAAIVGVLAVWALFSCVMLLGPWPGEGRPRPAAALRAAFAAACAVGLLTLGARGYLAATATLHRELFRSTGALIGVLVWCNLVCRVLLRSVAWAATANAAGIKMAGTQVIAANASGTRAGTETGQTEISQTETGQTETGQTEAGGTETGRASAAGADLTESAMEPDLWVVVPAYNEAASIGATLAALAAQTDLGFAVVVADNCSTDGTTDVVRRFSATAPFLVEIVTEPEPGAGSAADAGFRHAMARGATILARTDADCRPAPDWVATVRTAISEGAEMACGRSVPRRDEQPDVIERYLLPTAIRLAALYGRYRRSHRAACYRTPYVLCHGHNIAITADLYLRCGGTGRFPLRQSPEDVVLLNRARMHSDRVVRVEAMVVENSLRRLRAWGPRRTLLWYWDRRYAPADDALVHVR